MGLFTVSGALERMRDLHVRYTAPSVELVQRHVSSYSPARWRSLSSGIFGKKHAVRSSNGGKRRGTTSSDSVFLQGASEVSSYDIRALLGRGTFGSVHVAQHTTSGKIVALKSIQKTQIEEMRQETNVLREQMVHFALSHPFICKLLATFQDPVAVYFVMEYCPGGELYSILYDDDDEDVSDAEDFFNEEDETYSINSDRQTDVEDDEEDSPSELDRTPVRAKCSHRYSSAKDVNERAKRTLRNPNFGGLREEHAAFYLACVLDALEYLHDRKIMYRDVKLENIVLDVNGYPKLVDFGLSKSDATHWEASKSTTICGSMEYMAPELIERQPYHQAVDIWSFGILMYELLFAVTPFYHPNHREQGRRITEDSVYFPEEFETQCPEAADLIRALLAKEPLERPCNWQKIRKSSFFRKYFSDTKTWRKLMEKKLRAPFVPTLKTDLDTSLFTKAASLGLDLDDME
uniref:Protein kinase putative n=1 Tax=Albugo laibachii Nc14 TaxID=890382 RepID=F0WFW6_9STRA|nr:protein kinase putative [Albugo laibachii Nc14]|eukprot:CCA20100.1 protein kinase putative [Albugo laibachii Nc14]